MIRAIRNSLAAMGLTAGLLLSQPAMALLETCEVSATSVDFGIYDPLSGSETQSTGEIEVTCSLAELAEVLVEYEIKLSTGGSGTYFPREMESGASILEYQLYTDSSRTTVWGDGSEGTSTVTDGYLLEVLSETRTYPVYGSIPPDQMVAAGTYGDTITVTLEY